MENYADETYYTDTYKGSVISADSFDSYARKATLEIRKSTFGNVAEDNIPEEVRMCCCDLAEAIYKSEKSSHAGLSAEKIGEWSVSYENQANIDAKLKQDTKDIINNWLALTGLLYRGCLS